MIERQFRLLVLLIILFILAPVFPHAGELSTTPLPATKFPAQDEVSRVQENLDRVLGDLNAAAYERRYLLADYGGFGSSVMVRNAVENTDAPLTLVVAIPLHADYAVTSALSLAQKIQADTTPGSANIIIAFLGDEENALGADMGGIPHKGLRDLLALADIPENWVLCYIDINEPPERIMIRHGIRGYIAPLEIVKPLPELFRSYEIPWFFKIRHNDIYKLGLVEGPQALYFALDADINGFVLSGEGTGENTVSAEVFSDCLFEYAGTLSGPIIGGDSHYSHFTLPRGKAFFISAGLAASLLIIVFGLFLFYVLFNPSRFHIILIFNIKLFLKFSWFFLLMLPLMVFSVKISGLLYSILLNLIKPNESITNNAGAGFTVLLALFIFSLPSPLLDFIRFPKRARFYGISSVIFAALGLLFAAFLDFSYVQVFLWAFFFVFLASLLKIPVLVFLCVLLIPVFAVDTVFNIMETGSTKLAELLITSDWKAPDTWVTAIMTALFSLPLFLLIRRGILLFKESKQRGPKLTYSRKYRLVFIPILIAIVLTIMSLHVLMLPEIPVPERRFYASAEQAGLLCAFDSIRFQDSRIITVNIEADEDPVRFDVRLQSKNNSSLLPLYSSPVPFTREDGGRKLSFSLGENPTNPLIMEIVVPLEFDGMLYATALYNKWKPGLDPGETPKTDDYILGLTRSIDLGIPE